MIKILKGIDFSKFKSILCINGNLPHIEVFERFNKLPIIAADGAANKLKQTGIVPSIVIGDLDSVEKSILESYKTLRIEDQDFTDYQKCLKYIKDQNLGPSIVFGINGGYIDHILGNINIFLETKDIFIDEHTAMFNLAKGVHTFSFPYMTKISLFGIPECNISTTGLKWNLECADLKFPGFNSSLNRSKSDNQTIAIHEGNALINVYLKSVCDMGKS